VNEHVAFEERPLDSRVIGRAGYDPLLLVTLAFPVGATPDEIECTGFNQFDLLGDTVRLADVIIIAPNDDIAGGRRDAGLPVTSFVDLGKAIGVPERAVRKVLADMADKSDLWLPDLDQLPFGAGVVKKLRRVIERRRATLARAR
jgi:hypothetical protein